MDITLISQSLIIPSIVVVVTQLVKRTDSIAINPGQVTRIRTFVGGASFVLTLASAFLNHQLSSALTPDVIQVGVGTVVSFLIAHIGYHGATDLNK